MGPLSLLSVLRSERPASSHVQGGGFFWSYLLMWISYSLSESISREQWHQHYRLFCICSPKRYIEIVTPRASGCDPIWKWGLCTCNQDQMRSSQWPLIQYDLCLCRKRHQNARSLSSLWYSVMAARAVKQQLQSSDSSPSGLFYVLHTYRSIQIWQPYKAVRFLAPLYRWGNWGLEGLVVCL